MERRALLGMLLLWGILTQVTHHRVASALGAALGEPRPPPPWLERYALDLEGRGLTRQASAAYGEVLAGVHLTDYRRARAHLAIARIEAGGPGATDEVLAHARAALSLSREPWLRPRAREIIEGLARRRTDPAARSVPSPRAPEAGGAPRPQAPDAGGQAAIARPEVALYVAAAAVVLARTPPLPGLLVLSTGLAFLGLAGHLVLFAGRHPGVHAAFHLVPATAAAGAAWLSRMAAGRAQGAAGRWAPARAPGVALDTCVAALATLYGVAALSPHLGPWPSGLLAIVPGAVTFVLPLAWYLAARLVLASDRALEHLLWVVVVVGVSTSVYALVQDWLGPDYVQSLGPGHWEAALQATTKTLAGHPIVRPLGYGLDAGRSPVLSMAAVFAALALVPRVGGRARVVLAAGAAVALLALVASSVRALLVALIAGLAAIAWARPAMVCRTLAAVVIVVLVSVPLLGPGLLDRIVEAVERPTAAIDRFAGMRHELALVLHRMPLGAGAGRSGPAANRWLDPDRAIVGSSFESLPSALALEGGLPLLAAGIVTLVAVLAAGISRLRTARDDPAAVFATTLAAALSVLSMAGPVLYVAPGNTLFWLAAGILAGAPPHGAPPGQRPGESREQYA